MIVKSVSFLAFLFAGSVLGFGIRPHKLETRKQNVHQRLGLISSSSTTSSSVKSPKVPMIHDIPESFQPLFNSAINATTPRDANTSNQGHDSFRYEWGTWAVDSNVEYLMDLMNEVRVQRSFYETVVPEDMRVPLRLRVAGGLDWDCILHVLPPGTSWQGRWTTGSWAMIKTLTGVAEIASLVGPDRNGNLRKRTSKDLRGGSDGSLGGGQSTAGDKCIKYVGGPLRSYSGKYGKTVLLEVVIRPPISAENEEKEIIDTLEDVDRVLSIVKEHPAEDKAMCDGEIDKAPSRSMALLGEKMGMTFDQVGGLDVQLEAIARRVLASRANPAAARRLGVSHVRGILLSGPPGCGKTLLARELARILGAREPQIVNGPEILDKYIGEAERRVRDLFAPAEQEYKVAGDDSALHIIILDEMDAIARKRGTMTSDTTGVRDSVVNQLLAKMDGVREASNVLVVGLTNRPELLDPALLRPGRLEVQLRIELPDKTGRRDILRIHTSQMRKAGGLSEKAVYLMEDLGENGLPARTEHFSGAELSGLVRSAASFALGRTLQSGDNGEEGVVQVEDLEEALREVRPALGKQDEILKLRFPLGISAYSLAMERIQRDLKRFTSPVLSKAPRLQSLLVVGSGGSGGTGATALVAWASSEASSQGEVDYVRFVTALDLLLGGEGGGDEARAAALVERFVEARELPRSLLVLDDIDQLCAGTGPSGYSSVMIATLRALLRSPPPSCTDKANGNFESKSKDGVGRSVHVLAATSRSDAACVILHELFDETIVIPLLEDPKAVSKLILESLSDSVDILDADAMAVLLIERLGKVGCKTVLRLVERAVAATQSICKVDALTGILDDLAGDEGTAERLCETI